MLQRDGGPASRPTQPAPPVHISAQSAATPVNRFQVSRSRPRHGNAGCSHIYGPFGSSSALPVHAADSLRLPPAGVGPVDRRRGGRACRQSRSSKSQLFVAHAESDGGRSGARESDVSAAECTCLHIYLRCALRLAEPSSVPSTSSRLTDVGFTPLPACP